MLMRQEALDEVQSHGRTFVDYLIAAVLKGEPSRWQDFVVSGVSDIDDARSIDLLPSDTHLTLFEREVSKGDHEASLRRTVGELLREARGLYDLVLVDSAPGLSVLTESWLREADFYLSPTRPDYISTRGLKFLRDFQKRDAHMGFAECLGVVINMKENLSREDADYENWLRQDADNRCFQQALLRVAPLQAATRFAERTRSYWAKYPGQTAESLRNAHCRGDGPTCGGAAAGQADQAQIALGCVAGRLELIEGGWAASHICSVRDCRVPSSTPLRLDVAREVVENGLPPLALLLDRVRSLTIEGDADPDTIRDSSKLDPSCAIAEGVFNQPVLYDLRIGSGEIEAHAAIFCLHARGECAADPQVDRGSGRVPVVGRGIPLFDVLRRRIGAPNLLDGCSDGRLDSDLHRMPLAWLSSWPGPMSVLERLVFPYIRGH